MLSTLEAIIRGGQGIKNEASEDELRGLTVSGSKRGRSRVEALMHARALLDQLWNSGSQALTRAAELLANGSRERELCRPG